MRKESRSTDIETIVPRYPKSLLPTRKWLAAVVTAFGGFLTTLITVGEFNQEMQLALLGVVVSAAVAYLVPNNDNPGGYTPKGEPS
ncbi:MAG TPA: hypothetical protein VFB74_23380 [Kribbellaceae bacterium]|nr:hypothetical protein [Kribbellaceae bacterium]